MADPSPRRDEAGDLAELLISQPIANADRVAAALLADHDLVEAFTAALGALEDDDDAIRTSLVHALLQTPGADTLQIVFDIAAAAPSGSPRVGDAWCSFPYERDTVVGELIACRPADELFHHIATRRGTADPDTSLRVAHHLVALGHRVPDAARWPFDWATGSGHELAALPDHLTELEVHMPRFAGPSFDPVDDSGWRAPSRRCALGELISGFGDPRPVDHRAVTAAVADWATLSNGQLHAASWATGDQDTPGDEHPHPRQRISVADPAHVVSPADAVAIWFSAAYAGPAYGGTPGAGSSRLRCWQTIAGMTGVEWPAPLDRVAAAARTVTWVLLPADGLWRIRLLSAGGGRVVLVDALDID
jgi:hypothetical protein